MTIAKYFMKKKCKDDEEYFSFAIESEIFFREVNCRITWTRDVFFVVISNLSAAPSMFYILRWRV